jgi:uncharacterized membrane protein
MLAHLADLKIASGDILIAREKFSNTTAESVDWLIVTIDFVLKYVTYVGQKMI